MNPDGANNITLEEQIALLNNKLTELNVEYSDLQEKFIQREKLAFIGQLTAGILHEIKNPLNFVNNFSILSLEIINDINADLIKIKEKIDPDIQGDLDSLIEMLESNITKISENGGRAQRIIQGMLAQTREKPGEYELVDMNQMVEEYTKLAYQGVRGEDKEFNVTLNFKFDHFLKKIKVIQNDLGRVILNIVNNACFAVNEKKKNSPDFKPEISAATKMLENSIEIRIKDNGTGIPKSALEKIYQPFFTTKPVGKGTGLGLAMSFDIITKLHKGKLEVNTQEGQFTEFVITIPDNL